MLAGRSLHAASAGRPFVITMRRLAHSTAFRQLHQAGCPALQTPGIPCSSHSWPSTSRSALQQWRNVLCRCVCPGLPGRMSSSASPVASVRPGHRPPRTSSKASMVAA